MIKLHKEILDQLNKHSNKQKIDKLPENYLGSNHKNLFVKTEDCKQIAKNFLKNNGLNIDDFIELLNSLAKGETVEEKMMVGRLLGFSKQLRYQIDPKCLDLWLDDLIGWAEIDSLCQSNFKAKDILDNWEKWERITKKFNKDKNISKRRASLVLLTNVVGESDDKRLSDLAFENIENLKLEKDILITKAISWILRDLIKNHRKRVEEYLDKNSETLPKIAVREVTNKLKTGKK